MSHTIFLRRILIAGTLLVSVLTGPSIATEEATLAETIKEGTYRASDLLRFTSSHLLFEFHSRNKRVVGLLYSTSGTICFEGELSGNMIRSKNVVNLEREYRDGRATEKISFSPLRDLQVGDYNEFQPILPLRPFPDYQGYSLPDDLLAEYKSEVRACAVHFGEMEKPAPCGIPELRGTDESKDPIEPKYSHNGRICRWSESDHCKVDTVFKLLIETPSAVAPVDPGVPDQVVKDCGKLVLKGAVSTNEIVTIVDNQRHSVTNYTLRNHIFYPGSVIRYVSEGLDGVWVLTEGRGTEDSIRTWINQAAAPGIWDEANRVLREAFKARYEAVLKNTKKKP